MPIYKNQAGQKFPVYAFDSTTGDPVTGDAANITAQIAKDGGASAATNDVHPTELDSVDQPGIYLFDMTQAETNANLINLQAVSGTADVVFDPVAVFTTVGAGTGARTVTITVNDGSNPLEAARVRLTQGTESLVLTTNASGIATFNIDDATWTVAITKAGYSFSGASLVVDGDEDETYSMTLTVVVPADPELTTAFLTLSPAVEGAIVQVEILKLANGTVGSGINNPLSTGTTDAQGYVEFTGLPRLATYQVRIGDGKWFKGVTLDADTTPLAGVLGVAE